MAKRLNTFSQYKMSLVATCGYVPFQVKLAKKSHQPLQTCTCLATVLQPDNGGEFKKAVQKLCEKLSVKIVRGAPYHPQSQGKVERSHRALRKKISFDMAHLNKNGVNWIIQLKEYKKLQNEESMEALGRQSPF